MGEYRTWIDVTDFLRWEGNFTGFQHIQYNIAKQYLDSGKDVAFFIYDESAHLFKEVAFDPSVVADDGVIPTELEAASPAVSRWSLAHSTAKRLAPRPVKRIIKKVIVSREQNAKSKQGHAYQERSPFKVGDVVLVLGGIWHGSFAEDISEEKQKKHFKFVHIVHDMIPIMVPQYVVEDLPAVFATYKDKIFRCVDGLIVNSQSSKRDALAFMEDRDIHPPATFVFRIADEPERVVPKAPSKGLIGADFILSIGTIEGRKNHALLYYAYKQAAREGIELPKLVIAGRDGWLAGDIQYVIKHDPEVKNNIHICYNVTNSERAWLYSNCLFTIWPSFYEGWGMPVAESVAYGKLCLSSDTSSMKEIAGNLNDYFSPYDSRACLELIRNYLHKQERIAKEKRIKREYHVTTWNDMFNQISGFIDSLANE